MKRLLLLLACLTAAPVSAQVPTVLNIEIDYMVDPGDHTHRPTQTEIDAVVQMFACQGITLNVEISDALTHREVLRRDPSDCVEFFDYDAGNDTFLGIKNANFDRAGQSGWHYGIFGHRYQARDTCALSGSSGLAETLGDDFVVTLGSFADSVGTPWDRAATLAHEFGHNLGLGHAGDMDASVVGNYAPNVPSVMSYFYQLRGVRTNLQCQGLISADAGENHFRDLDYSHGRACTLNENFLNESFGAGIIPVDWSCDGNISGTTGQDLSNSRTVDGWCTSSGVRQTLNDYNEWANIQDGAAFAQDPNYKPEVIECITSDEVAALQKAMPPCPQATLAVESCVNDEMHYASPGVGGGNGMCTDPFVSLQEAEQDAGSGDLIYFGPGSYPASGLILDKRLLLLGPGGAVFGN